MRDVKADSIERARPQLNYPGAIPLRFEHRSTCGGFRKVARSNYSPSITSEGGSFESSQLDMGQTDL